MSARQDVVMAPVSPGLAKLLHKLQAQIINDAQERASEQPAGAVVLLPVTGAWRADDDADHLSRRGSDGSSERFTRRRFCPAGWQEGPFPVPWHPSHWRQNITRVDSTGQAWEQARSSRIHVTDDFGFLVPLAECFQ